MPISSDVKATMLRALISMGMDINGNNYRDLKLLHFSYLFICRIKRFYLQSQLTNQSSIYTFTGILMDKNSRKFITFSYNKDRSIPVFMALICSFCP